MRIDAIDRFWMAPTAPSRRAEPSQRLENVSASSASAVVASGGIARNALPVDAPKETDAQLWSVLTSSERSYFDRAGATRSVTYGPAGRAGTPASLGRALDLRA